MYYKIEISAKNRLRNGQLYPVNILKAPSVFCETNSRDALIKFIRGNYLGDFFSQATFVVDNGLQRGVYDVDFDSNGGIIGVYRDTRDF